MSALVGRVLAAALTAAVAVLADIDWNNSRAIAMVAAEQQHLDAELAKCSK